MQANGVIFPPFLNNKKGIKIEWWTRLEHIYGGFRKPRICIHCEVTKEKALINN